MQKSRKNIVVIDSHAQTLYDFRGPLLKALVGQGFKVFALAPDYNIENRESIQKLGAVAIDFKLSRTGINPLTDIIDTIKLISIIKAINADIFLAYTIKPAIYGIFAAMFAGVRRKFVVISGLGYVFTLTEESNSLKRRALKRIASLLYKTSLAMVDNAFFQNDDDANEFIANGLIDKNKALCIRGTGVDLSEYKECLPFTKPITFTITARLLREKGIIEFVSAARRIKKMHPDVRFVVCGGLDSNPGSLSISDVQNWVDEGTIEWPGHVPVQYWLSQTSVFVLPSYREGVPRSTQEALAMGRPVITTDAPGCRETVIDGVNGFMIPVRDVNALVDSMLKFISNPTLIGHMGNHSRILAVSRFDINKINKEIISKICT
jgi:glycosyltransferase involved in cell wall biosynthesis